MPCACERCLRHSQTLGLPAKPPSKGAIRKAYKASAKLWHPDRFEGNPVKRLEAEEHFKQIQVAYRELWEHCEKPAKKPVESAAHGAREKPPAPMHARPAIFFGDAPGCFSFPYFPSRVLNVIVEHVQDPEWALAFVDLTMTGVRKEFGSQYIILTSHRMIVRDAMNVVSLLWYTDLGEVLFVDQQEKRSSIWERIVERVWGIKHRYLLQINRLNGTSFYSIAGQAHDNIKKVIYNFLVQMKQQPRQ